MSIKLSYALCLMSFTLEQAYDTSKGKSGIKANSHIDDTTRHDSMRHDPFFGPHTFKWICSHICCTTKSGRHDKKLRQQKSL